MSELDRFHRIIGFKHLADTMAPQMKPGDRKNVDAYVAGINAYLDSGAALPPELRPRVQKKGSLRKVTCPGCGLVYWTNRETDLCMECGKKG